MYDLEVDMMAAIVQALTAFVRESNRIEGIVRPPTPEEIAAHSKFLCEPVSVESLETLVAVLQPNAQLRRRAGLNVRVGNHVPPPGGPEVEGRLRSLLANDTLDAYQRHVSYETLHPFTDGNGRSGRALWLHNTGRIPAGGFLRSFYYEALQHSPLRR